MMQVNERGTTQILPETKQEVKYCPACYQNGTTNQLKLYQINMFEAVYLCPNYLNCLYPQGNGWDFVNRSIDEMITDSESSDNETAIEDEVERIISKIKSENFSQIKSENFDKDIDEFSAIFDISPQKQKNHQKSLSVLYTQMDNRLKYLDGKVVEIMKENDRVLAETEPSDDLIKVIETIKENGDAAFVNNEYLDELDNFLSSATEEFINIPEVTAHISPEVSAYVSPHAKTEVSNHLPKSKRIKIVSQLVVPSNIALPINTKNVSTQCFTVECSQQNQLSLKTVQPLEESHQDSVQQMPVVPVHQKSSNVVDESPPTKLIPKNGAVKKDLFTKSSTVFSLNKKGKKINLPTSISPPEWKSLSFEKIKNEDCSRIRVVKNPAVVPHSETRNVYTVPRKFTIDMANIITDKPMLPDSMMVDSYSIKTDNDGSATISIKRKTGGKHHVKNENNKVNKIRS